MTNPDELVHKGDSRPDDAPRTLTGAQLSSSGQHLSTTGSGVRKLLSESSEAIIAVTEDIPRPPRPKA